MTHRLRLSAGLALACLGLSVLAPSRVHAAPDAPAAPPADEVSRLRSELDTLRQEYAARIAQLEARLAALEGGVAAAPPAAPGAAAPAASSKAFNPDIGVVGNFIAAAGETPGGGEPSLEMHETELSFQAAVDPYARADFFLTVGPEEVGLEEGYVTFPALPGGFLLRAGKMRDVFGRVDAQHSHMVPFADRPLVSRNLLGGAEALADSGVSLARLIPNPWLFLEATAQVFRGESELFQAPRRRDLAYVGHLRAYRDLTESVNVELGGSIAYGHNGSTPDAATRLVGVDATLRYRPLRRAIYTRLLARGELVWSRRQDPGGTSSAAGGYGHLEYQFARRWSAGLRYDDSGRASEPGARDRGGAFVLSFSPSEFSQLRAQYRHTRLAGEQRANELLLQLIYAIGAHGAHPF